MGRPGNAYCVNYALKVDTGGEEGGGEGGDPHYQKFIIKYSTARQDPRHMHSCMRVLSL